MWYLSKQMGLSRQRYHTWLKDTSYLWWIPNSGLNLPTPLPSLEGPSSINRLQMGFSCLSNTLQLQYIDHWGIGSLGVDYPVELMQTSNNHIMMTSSNENIFRVTGHLCGNSPVPGEFRAQRPVTRSFDVFLDLYLNKQVSKQSWGWWSETLTSSLWRQFNVIHHLLHIKWTQVLQMAVINLRVCIYYWFKHISSRSNFHMQCKAPCEIT